MKSAAWLLLAGTLVAGPSVARAEQGEHEEEAAVSESEEKEILSFIRTQDAGMAEHLSHAKSEKPEMYRQKLREISHMYRDPDIREHFVKQHQAHNQVQKLAQACRRAKGPEREAAKKELEKALGDLFDQDLAQKEIQIKKMQEQIAKVREKIAQRKAKKDAYVKKRLDKMTGDEEDDW